MHALLLAALLCSPPPMADPLPDVTLDDADRLPGPEVRRAAIRLAQAHLHWLEAVSSLGAFEASAHAAWRQEAAELLALWQAVDGAADEALWPPWRLTQLEYLLSTLGPAAYYSWPMRLSPPVPLWRYAIH